MGALKPWHIIVLVLLVLLLFGAGKLPSLARNVGKSMRIFKSEVEELRGDDKVVDEDDDLDDRRRRPAARDRFDDERPRERERVEVREREYDTRDGERVHVREEDTYRRD